MTQDKSKRKITVWYWQEKSGFFDTIILWDGENTYWLEDMDKPSGGYFKMRTDICPVTNSRFVYIGEL